MIKVKHNKVLFWVIIFLLILLFAVLIEINVLKAKINSTASLNCTSDADCIKRQVTCCPCNSGGQEVCLSKNNVTYLDNLKSCPSANQLICAQVYNCKSTSCVCKQGSCVEE